MCHILIPQNSKVDLHSPVLRLFEVRPRFGHVGGLGVCCGLAGQLRGGDGCHGETLSE